jgi:hypothetical protein
MTGEKEIKTVKEYIELKNELEKLARNADISLVMFTDIIDYKTDKLKAIIVQYPPTHSILITSKRVLEMIENKELVHPYRVATREVFLNISEVFNMIVEKLALKYKIYKSDGGASIYKIYKHRYLHVGSIDICSEGKEEVLEKEYKLKTYTVRCRNFIIKIISSDENDIRNLTNIEILLNEYINFGEFRFLESDYCRMV